MRETRFKKGDRVYHQANGSGTVTDISTDGTVYVQYDKVSSRTGQHWFGIYDLRWFEIRPNALKKEIENV